MFGTTPDNTPDLLDDKQVSVDTENPLLLRRASDYLGTPEQDDGLVSDLLLAAKGHFEDLANHFVDLQTREVIFDRFSSRYAIPATPVKSLETAKAYENGSEKTGFTDASDWFLHPSDPPQIRRKDDTDLPGEPVDSYRFTYQAGYDSTADVPEQLKLVVRKMVHDLYDFRSSQVDSGLNKAEMKTDWDSMIEAELKTDVDMQPPFAYSDLDDQLARRRSQIRFNERLI